MTQEEQAMIGKALDALTAQLQRVNAALELLLESLAERQREKTDEHTKDWNDWRPK